MKSSPNSPWPIIMILTGILLILGVGVWYLATENLFALQATEAPAAVLDNPSDAVPRISPADAKAAYDNGSAVFLDVRDSSAYAQSHIKGALLIPLNELPDRTDELSPSDWIITYCT